MATATSVEVVSSRPGSIVEIDKSMSLMLYRQVGSRFPRPLFLLLEHSGNGVLWLLGVPIAWLWPGLGAVARYYIANFFLGLWVDLAIVGFLKALFRRPRPLYNYSKDFVLVVAVDKYSLPSGHAARVGYIAAFGLLCIIERSVLLSLLLSSWALATALSRALMGRHYIGDVLIGLCTGLLTTAIVTKGTFHPAVGWFSKAQSDALLSQLHDYACSHLPSVLRRVGL